MLLLASVMLVIDTAESARTIDKQFGPFDQSYYDVFKVDSPAMISNGALQITPDSAGSFTLTNQSGRVLFHRPFKLWDGVTVASFNTSFLINIFRLDAFPTPGEGLAFVIAPDLGVPPGSDGQYLGLTNSTTDGSRENHLVAIEFDTLKQDFDPDSNHIGLDINSVRSNHTVSLSDFGFELAPNDTKFFHVWVIYDGAAKRLRVYMVDEDTNTTTKPMPSEPVMDVGLDISQVVNQDSYFGFAASTGAYAELNCVLGWNLTVENLSKGHNITLALTLGIGLPLVAILAIGLWCLAWVLHRRRAAADDPNILGALKSLPGTPREFKFKELRKATNNFDEKNRLGEGGFGVVYKGVLPPKDDSLEIAVKRFSRDKIKSKDDFLAELTIINRLRHRHLVRLLGKLDLILSHHFHIFLFLYYLNIKNILIW